MTVESETLSIGTCFDEGKDRCQRGPSSVIVVAGPIRLPRTVLRASHLVTAFDRNNRWGLRAINARLCNTSCTDQRMKVFFMGSILRIP